MRILLLWRSERDAGPHLNSDRVTRKLQQMFSPLFSKAPESTIRQSPAMTMIFLELPVRGWKPPFFEEDEQTWALAVEYPIDARVVLESNGVRAPQDAVLPTLCRQLQGEPAPLLREMAPPFSLIWSSKPTGETFVQNDGLGQAQLFEYQDSRLWAVTNKIFALKALGIELELEPEEWAVKSTLDWFPMDTTGYKRIQYLRSGTQICLNADGITRTTHDVLMNWVNPSTLSRADCLELARCSLLKQIRAATPLWEKPVAELTGGWDTRAVVSSLRLLGTEFSARVRGHPEHHDVIVASRLAKKAGIDLRVIHSAVLPPDNADDCRRSISRALVWQAGHSMSRQHKEFLSNQEHLDNYAYVKIMGQHGEIGRAFYAKKIQALRLNDEHLVNLLMEGMPPFMKDVFHDRVRQFIREAYRQADRYGLAGLARLDFFYLYERTRRWASAKLNVLPALHFPPFLNPDYIRAVFGYPGHDKETNPFHRHIIATHFPEWNSVPYASDLARATSLRATISAPEGAEGNAAVAASWRECTARTNYTPLLYWKDVGIRIIRDALAEGGFWTEVFDPQAAHEQWLTAPDQLAVVHLLPQVLGGHFPS